MHVVDALWRREAWRSAPGPAVRQLAWSAAGRRLAALGAREVRIFSARGRLLRTLRSPARMRNVALAFPPAGGGEAVLLRRTVRGARSEIVTVPGGRSLLAGPGRITDLAFAPGGGWLLAGWRDADQWVFLQRRGRRVAAVSGMVAQFSPGARRASGFPRIDGWCCSGDS